MQATMPEEKPALRFSYRYSVFTVWVMLKCLSRDTWCVGNGFLSRWTLLHCGSFVRRFYDDQLHWGGTICNGKMDDGRPKPSRVEARRVKLVPAMEKRHKVYICGLLILWLTWRRSGWCPNPLHLYIPVIFQRPSTSKACSLLSH